MQMATGNGSREKRDYIQLSSYKLMCCVFDGLSMQPKSSNTIFMSSHLLMKPKKHILLHCIISYEVILLLLWFMLPIRHKILNVQSLFNTILGK